MRILVMMLALALAIPVSAAAQPQSPGQARALAPAQVDRHTFLPQHKTRLSIDFGAGKAVKNLAQLPIRCDSVKKHRHELPSGAGGFVELPFLGAHKLKTVPVTPCPVR